MTKFDTCLTSLNLRDSVPVDALQKVAAQYQAGGMTPAAAMLRAVEDQLQLAQMEEANIVKTVRAQYEAQGGAPRPAPAAEPKPLDHGELNIPGRLTNIDRDLDRYKAEQEKESKAKAKTASEQKKTDKAHAKELMEEHGAAMLDKYGPKFDRKELAKEFDSMVKWEPAKFIKLAETFAKEQQAAAAEPKLAPVEEAPAPIQAEPEAQPTPEKPKRKPRAKKAEPEPDVVEEDDLRASLTDTRTIEVDGVRRPIRNSLGELVAPDFTAQVEFWKNYTGPVDDQGRPVVEPGDEARAANGSAASAIDGQVAQLARDGATADEVLALIEETTSNADQRALAKALRKQKLQTHVAFGNPQGRYLSGNAEQANASYRASDDSAFLHKEAGAAQSALHELVHAATLRALSRGGLAASQIKAMHKQVQAMPSFAGYYGITDPEEFIAEALTSPAFRQQLADTPAPGALKRSLWQKFVGIVRMALGLPAASESMLDRVMAITPDLMAENRAQDAPMMEGVRASMASALSGAANDIAGVRLPANYLVGDLFNKTGKLSWWHKTIGTMDNLSRRQPMFRKVYDSAQSFIGDVSRYGVMAADQSPTLLPKLENVADILGAKRKKAVSAEDTKAFGRPVWEGTLIWSRDANGKPVKVADLEAQAEAMTTKQKASILIQKGIIDDQQNQAWLGNPLGFYDSVIGKKYAESQLRAGIVWTDAELRSMFNLTPHQMGLYKEFRSGVNKSLGNLAISEMVKLGGKDAKGMMEQAVAAPNVQAASDLLAKHFRDLARANPKQADMHLDTANQIVGVADKAQDLMDRGYAPLSRYGKYTVYVEEGGEQVYFGMFETQAEASRMTRKMKADNPNASVIHGTMSEEAYKLFAGVSPETIELFGSAIGMDQAEPQGQEVYQAYLKLAKNNRSAMKRMIQRKGVAGFSEDAGRVLAGFIYSNARLTSANAHLGEIDEAVNEIPKQQGELKDAAVQLREHIRNPAPGTALGGLMFAQFLGGSVASAMVNLTQPLTMTFPFLSQYGGAVKAGKRMKDAIAVAGKKSTGDAQLDAALKWAADEGIVAPQEIHYLQAQASGKASLMAGDGTKAGEARAAINNTMAKVMLGWGKLFALAELSNRRITFIAAYRTAIEEGTPNPTAFAAEAVSQTQGTYNQGNKPKWARNPVGGLLLTFKQFSISYMELLARMAFAGAPGSPERAAGQQAALLMVAVLFLMGGWDGLPFEKDLEDLLDGILQRLGYNFSTARKKQEFLTNVLGEGGADFALKGVSSLPGMPIDVSGRFGMGNLIPATGLLTKKDSYARDLGELAGPAGDLAKRAFTGAGKALGGDLAGAALEISPVSVRNVVKGADMASTGSYNDARGYKVNDTTLTEAAFKAIGFQPNSTADIQEQKGQALNMIGQARLRSQEIAAHWAQGMLQQDPAMIQQARDQMIDWNEKNPETPIRIKMPDILKRVKNMKMDATNRTQKTAPKALKESVRAELADTRE